MNKTVLIDCMFLCHRAKHTTGLGLKNGIIFGFFNQLSTVLSKLEYNNIAFIWDSTSSIRKKYCPGYKAKDPVNYNKYDLEAYKQFKIIKNNIIPDLFINNFLRKGYEADDLIASIIQNNSGDFIIVSGDNDMLQLLNESVCVKNPKVKKLITQNTFIKEYGIHPNRWAEVKAIGGCVSDKVKGIKGVAEKTAIKYILGQSSKKIADRINTAMATESYELDKWLVTLPLSGTPKIKLRPYKPPTINAFINFVDKYSLKSFSLDKWIHLLQLQ